MYISYKSTNNGLYASAAVSKRNGKDTSVSYIYLGRVLDKDKGIYKSRERGIFTFDPSSGNFGSVSESYVPPKMTDKRKKRIVCVDFGDAFFLNEFLCRSGMWDVIDSIGYGNSDTLHAMVLFYTLSHLANCDAQTWLEGSIASLIYPDANLSSQRVSDFLASIGQPEKILTYQQAYIQFAVERYNKDQNILIDSSGFPNNIHGRFTQWSNHNGKISREMRLIFVVQKSTGLPLYYNTVAGNIVDVNTLRMTFEHLKALGIDISSCIMDAGYNSSDNLDLFYDDNHQCRIGFITRISANDASFNKMIKEELPHIEDRKNFIQYGDRYLFIVRRQIMVGKNKDNPAWLYLGLDLQRMTMEKNSLFKKAKKNNLNLSEVYEAMQSEGMFGVLSGKEYSCEEILPAYYQRQSAEQIFDIMKNYTKALPLRANNEQSLRGHLLLSYISSCIVRMILLKLKEVDLFMGAQLECLRNQKCTIYNGCVVTDVPQKNANDTYKAFNITVPASIDIENGKLKYIMPKSDSVSNNEGSEVSNKRKKRGRPKGSKNKKTLERERLEKENPPIKRKRGRPKGSKNKKTLEREAMESPKSKRRPGRPKGSKNKAKMSGG